MRFFGVSRRAPRLAADRLAGRLGPASGRWAGTQGQVVGEADYETGGAPGHGRAVPRRRRRLAPPGRGHPAGRAPGRTPPGSAASRAFRPTPWPRTTTVLKVFADLGLRVHPPLRRARGALRGPAGRGRRHYLAAVEPGPRRRRGQPTRCCGPARSPSSAPAARPGSVGRAVLRNICTRGASPAACTPSTRTRTRSRACPPTPRSAALPGYPTSPWSPYRRGRGAGRGRGVRQGRGAGPVVVTSGLDAAAGGRLHDACRTYGMRLVGPNCLGHRQHRPGRCASDADFAAASRCPAPRGRRAVGRRRASRCWSGLARLGIGVSTFVSLGDKYDVSGNDMLQWWESDGQHRPGPAAPGVLRQPARVLPHRPPGHPPHARPDRRRGPLRRPAAAPPPRTPPPPRPRP